jgi:hypothetical protein
MAHTKDPAERAELKKYIDELKAVRRDLEGTADEIQPEPR